MNFGESIPLPQNNGRGDGLIWLNRKPMAELFAVSKMNVSHPIAKVLNEGGLESSVVKQYFTTAADGKQYKGFHYALEMISASQDAMSRAGSVPGREF